MPPLYALTLAACTFFAVYAVSALRDFTRTYLRQPSKARRKGVLINLARRAGPPVVAGLAMVIFRDTLGLPRQGVAVGVALATGGVAYGLHRAVAELGPVSKATLGVRFAVTAGLSLAILWQAGVI